MRIASVIVSLAAGGAENLVANLATEFVKAGHEACVIALSNADQLAADPAYEAALAERVQTGGATVERLALANRRNLVSGSLALRRSIVREKPDILHIHTPIALLYAQWPKLDVPIVYTHHNTRLSRLAPLRPLFDRVVDRYVAIGGALETLLLATVRGPVTQIRNGVPLPATDCPNQRIYGPDLSMVAVGSLRASKDYINLVRGLRMALGTLQDRFGSVHLTIAGEGPERAAVQAECERLGLEDIVSFAGNVAVIPPLLESANLFVSGAKSEGLPIAMLEAAASGLPIVATDVGSVASVVRDGVNGRLVPPSDPAALAEALVAAASDADRLRTWSLASRQVAEEFSISACARQHLALYETLLRH